MPGPSDRPETRLVLMGRIGAAHGIRGEVRLRSFCQDPAAIATYSPFLTDRPGLSVTIESTRPAKAHLVARLEGVADRNAAERLNGVELYIPRDRLPNEDDADDFYHADLIGLEARQNDGSVMGTVLSVPNFGAGDLLEIGHDAKNAVYLPFTRAVVPQIHLDKGYLIVVPPAETTAGDMQ